MPKKKILPVAVVGSGMIKFGELFSMSFEDMIVEAYKKCLRSVDKGIDEEEIEAAWLGITFGSLIRRESVTGASLAEPLGLLPKPVTRVENACASGSDAVRNAAFAVAAGIYDCVLVVGVEKMRDVPSQDSLIAQMGISQHLWWHPRGSTAPSLFGQFATSHMKEYGTKREHLAMIAVKNHANGAKNPLSHFQMKITLEQALNAPMVSWPLGLYDCCPTTDGAAAVILVRAEMAKRYTDKPLYFLGTGLATDTMFTHWKKSYTSWPAAASAAEEAYEMAGIGPKDVDVAEVHDCFTITELISYEDLGFCKKGEGGKFIEEGRSHLDGEVAVNSSGGLKSKGHPIGATGVAQIYELWEQLKEEAGERQVKNAQIGLTHNLGGSGSIVCVNIFGTEPR